MHAYIHIAIYRHYTKDKARGKPQVGYKYAFTPSVQVG